MEIRRWDSATEHVTLVCPERYYFAHQESIIRLIRDDPVPNCEPQTLPRCWHAFAMSLVGFIGADQPVSVLVWLDLELQAFLRCLAEDPNNMLSRDIWTATYPKLCVDQRREETRNRLIVLPQHSRE